MARTLAEFHEAAADMLHDARQRHDGRDALGPYLCEASQDAVTIWRHTAHLLNNYANGEAARGRREGWAAFWADGVDRAGFLRLLEQRSRFNRCGPDGQAETFDDSVAEWERSLAHDIAFRVDCMDTAEQLGKAEAIRRIGHEHEVSLSLAAAYTGCDLADLRRATAESKGKDATYSFPGGVLTYTPHPLRELITANRPTV